MRSRSPRRLPVAAQVAVLVLVLLLGILIGGHPTWLPSPLRSALTAQPKDQLVTSVLDLIEQDYYRPVDRGQLLDKGVTAMVASLNDPYSRYYDPVAYTAFLNESNPHLSGVGVDVVPSQRGLTVMDVFPGAPAAKAGLEHGDLIFKVGGVTLAGHTEDYDSSLIRGPAGTRVVLTVLRDRKVRQFTVTRANIVVPVASDQLITDHGVKIGYLTLTAFTSGCGAQLRADTEAVLHEGAQALILDLRENGGGLLNEAINVASIFVPDGTIVTTRGRAQPTQVYLAKGGAISTSIPMVVLVDRDTASSAEIVTAALQDHRRAEVVGTRTYGKGVFQEIQPISGGGALDITVGEYFTPNGTNLGGGGVREGRGIRPNVYAYSNPQASGDHALAVAERVVAAEVR